MITISLCMIVKNEEKTLANCLNSVKDIADEIIIVDTGSTDKTKEIARNFTNKIYDFQWIDDFSAARNFAFEKAQMDYQLWLDADDIIDNENRQKLKNLKGNLSQDIDVVMMWYNTGFDADGNVTFRYYRERLLKQSRNFRWAEPIHECIPYFGKVIYSDISITHRKDYSETSVEKDRNLKIYEKLLSRGKVLSPRGQYYYSRELKDNGFYEKAIKSFTKFLESDFGWKEDKINACLEAANCLKTLNKYNDALLFLYKSFQYDLPRAEICCNLAYIYKALGDYKKAIFWFETAIYSGEFSPKTGFVQEDYKLYIPSLELAVCYDFLGSTQKAIKYNETAGSLKPKSPAYLHNKKYFENKTNQNN